MPQLDDVGLLVLAYCTYITGNDSVIAVLLMHVPCCLVNVTSGVFFQDVGSLQYPAEACSVIVGWGMAQLSNRWILSGS